MKFLFSKWVVNPIADGFENQTFKKTAMACALSMVIFPSAMAQEVATLNHSDTSMTLGEVIVKTNKNKLEANKIFTSVDILPEERIENQAILNNWQLFNQIPGVMLTQFGQGTTSGKFSMRGFNGEGEINAVKLLIDGVPSNSNDGNMPYIDVAPFLDIEFIEVVRGTNDPRYGLHNIAGNANISTKKGGNYLLGRATLGSFNTRQLQTSAGMEKEGFSQNYALSYQSTDGHRDHSEAENISLSGKWFIAINGKSKLGLIARHYEAKAEEAGYLTAAQVRQNANQSPAHNASDEDKRKVTQLALQAETELNDHLLASGQIYMNRLDDRRFVRFSAGVSQQERFVSETHIGASSQLTWHLGKTSLGDITVISGLDTEHQDNRSERYNTVLQNRSAKTRDQQFDFNTVGGFVQTIIKPISNLTVTPAFRVDKISGSYTNQLNSAVYQVNDYGLIKQPKISAMYAISNAISFYGNWGRSFQVGVGTASYKVNQNADLAPSINDGWEFGFKFRPSSWMDGRIAIWRQTASNEARRKLNDPANDAENIGKTQRQGIDFEINARPNDRINVWASAALQRSKILKADNSSLATEGKEIDHAPHVIYGMGIDYRLNEAWQLSTWANGQSSYYLERTNSTGEFGQYLLLNSSVRYKYNQKVSMDLQVRNLTNRYHEYVWYDGSQSLHAPGPSRSVYGSINLRF